ncbi:MAG: cytochrome c3 family protein [Planctomycetota bacterium]
MNLWVKFGISCLSILLTEGWAVAQTPGRYAGNCTDSACHKGLTELKVVHAPITQGACDACHESIAGEEHKFRLARTGGELCTECHEDVTKDLPFVHGPVAVGACTACHQAHSSNLAHLLVREEKNLCVECHSAIQERLGTGSHVHRPVSEGCLGCHQGHGAKNKMMLSTEAPRLCLDCHGEIETLLSDNPHQHGPVGKGECAACHDPHGSVNAALLAQDYPPKFYAPFVEKAYSLCFECHESEAFTEKLTDKATGFRDGTRNLHYLHVNQSVKGRTCRACHDPHATKNSKQILESVPFGTWKIPLNFKETEIGGSCAPGCHKPATYKRTETAGVSP